MISGNTYYLSFGGNFDDTILAFNSVIELLNRSGVVTQKSPIYLSEAWGFEEEVNDFYNQVIAYQCLLNPFDLLKLTQLIEKSLGREKLKNKKKYESRLIDIDILFHNQTIIKDNELTIPHYLAHERRFILKPLCDIAPDFIHPIFNKSIIELLLHCKDEKKVKPLER